MNFELSFPAAVHAGPVTGRLFVILTRSDKSEPRLQLFDVPLFSADVSQLEPEATVFIDPNALGYPINNLAEIPAGEYYVQGLLNVYTQFNRADGQNMNTRTLMELIVINIG